MSTLILPVAGQSTRFKGMRPKWLLTMPCGSLMIEKSISKMQLNRFERIVIICLKEHIEKYVDFEKLQKKLSDKISIDVKWVVLEDPTNSQSETIYRGIAASNTTGPIFIKDCDNVFSYEYNSGNEIAVIDLNKIDLIDAKNKSYVQVSELGEVTNIVEKQVISNKFCCGGYGFKEASDFIRTFDKLTAIFSDELYVSHIIYDMILSDINFIASDAADYIDWGTKAEFLTHTRKFVTIFCDIDGVLLENGSEISKNGWNTEPINENIAALIRLRTEGRLFLILTTSRSEAEEEQTLKILSQHGIVPDRTLFGLPHTQRYLINDFAPTNPYPSALAINIERNSNKLQNLFAEDMMK
ncbi:NTP transferase domain-containing protein [Planktomarina temperata]|nr:NTP transferase domain-containing protein [Planktomarina temperata]